MTASPVISRFADMSTPPADQNATSSWLRLGLSWPAVVGLAALGAPRVVLHDFGALDGGFGLASLLLTVGPLAVWVLVLTWRQARPLVRTGAAIGGVFGIMLVAIHQILWSEAYDSDPPRLGGNLAGKFDEGTEEAIFRAASVPSGLAVGLALGALAGFVARLLVRRADRLRRGCA